MKIQDKILAYSLKYAGDWQKITKALATNEIIEKATYTGKYITFFDSEYPDSLRKLRYPPWIIFYLGNLNLLHGKLVGIVGSRIYSPYGKNATIAIVKQLKKEFTIVSGLAKGIDAIAHQESLDGHTIAVLGCGINYIYPLENKGLYAKLQESQLIISEYPGFTKPMKHYFPWRNRLIAALSRCIIVCEAKSRSGTLLTAREANNLGKDIYCIPYPYYDINGYGCNLLIENGAHIIYDISLVNQLIT